jgi:PAS domain S-box-containing protein
MELRSEVLPPPGDAPANEAPSRSPPSRSRLPATSVLVIVGPLAVLVLAGAIMGIASWLFGGQRVEMLIAAALAGVVAGVLATLLLYRAARERRDANARIRSITARVSDIVEAAMDPIITVDAEQRIVLFNSAAEKAFGWPRKGILGQPLDRLLPERFRDAHRVHVGRFAQTGATVRRMGGAAVLKALRSNGEEFPIEASISQHSEDGRQLLTVVLRDVSERVRVDEQLRRSQDELRNFAAAANLAREQEQSRLARELHDELGQTLTALQMDAAWCKARVPESDPMSIARHAKMETTLKETVAATRRIATGLRPLMLDDLGLVPAVDWLVETFTERHGIPCQLTVEGEEITLPSGQATAVFRIVQESLVNIGKHAQASKVGVTIEYGGRGLTVRVVDDGIGFAVDAPRKPNSYGLLGLRERALLSGGDIAIESAPARGTSVVARIPLEPPAP